MDYREPVAADFVGKVIERVDLSAANIWCFFFTDGSKIAIEALLCSVGPGYLPYMRVNETSVFLRDESPEGSQVMDVPRDVAARKLKTPADLISNIKASPWNGRLRDPTSIPR